jgi:HSP20 family protein
MNSLTQTQRAETEAPAREKQTSREVGTFAGEYFEPAVDIYETAEALTVVTDVPGADPDSIETDLRDNLLTITARVKPVEGNLRPLHTEYRIGHFTRQFRLGQHIDQSKISAVLKDGVLTLTLPKAESVKPRKIQVQTAP